MEDFVQKYRAVFAKRKLFKFLYFGVMALAFLGGMAGIIASAVKDDYSKLTMYVIIALAVPVVLWIIYLISIATGKDKKLDALAVELLESNLTADEIMKVGDEIKMSLFNVAIIKRKKELGLESIPEWCVRDGVLPTAEDL